MITLLILLTVSGLLLKNDSTAYAKNVPPNQIVSNPSQQTSDDTLLSYRKSITQTDTDAFTITLDVATRQSIQTIKGKSASVVLVLDNSGSMGFGEGTTPGDYARDALKEFADHFFVSNSQNKLGLVTYSGYGSPEFDAYDEIKYVANGDSLINDQSLFNQVVDSLDKPNGETNVQMGIKRASDILEADTTNNPKFIVLFSDGAANRSAKPLTAEPLGNAIVTPINYKGQQYSSNFKFTSFDYSNYGNSTVTIPPYTTSNARALSALSEAFMAHDKGINLYSIFYHNPSLNDIEYGLGLFVMKNSATSGQYTEIEPGNAADFAKIFTEIEQKIQESVSPWQVQDPMADYIEFAGFSHAAANDSAEFIPETNTLKWNPREMEGVQESDGSYRYTLSYNIRLQSEKEGFKNEEIYPTNNTTTLTYQKIIDPDVIEEKQVDFIVPQVKGSSGTTNILHVKALDMIAYQEGNSGSGDPFPRPYFAFFWDDNGQPGVQLTQSEIESLTFTVDDQPHSPGQPTFFIYEYPFRTQYVNTQTGAIHNDPAALDESPGLYNIHFTKQDYDTGHQYTIAAKDKDGNVYDFRFDQSGILEIREQSNVPTEYTPYETGTPAVDFSGKAPTVFLPDNTQLYNTAGIPLNDSFIAKVTLLSDGVLPHEVQGIDTVLRQRADMINKSYVISYLQLVDNEDGNIVVEANSQLSVFYPYPPGKSSQDDFTVLHFFETDRTVGQEPVYTASNPLVVTKMDNGLMFTTNGTMDGFGPFVIAYSDDPGTPLPQAGGTGITGYIIIGLLLIASALVLLISLRYLRKK